MKVDAYDIAIIGGCFTIVGALIGSLIGYWLACLLAERYALIAAKAKLRAAFSLALGCIFAASQHQNSDPDRPDVSSFLKDAFVGHAAAVEEFRGYVSTKSKGAYEKAWQEYCALGPTLVGGNAEFSVSDQPNPLNAIQERIHAILSFAKT